MSFISIIGLIVVIWAVIVSIVLIVANYAHLV